MEEWTWFLISINFSVIENYPLILFSIKTFLHSNSRPKSMKLTSSNTCMRLEQWRIQTGGATGMQPPPPPIFTNHFFLQYPALRASKTLQLPGPFPLKVGPGLEPSHDFMNPATRLHARDVCCVHIFLLHPPPPPPPHLKILDPPLD